MQLPEVIDAATIPDSCEQVDVVVIGFGIAGGCAALEAARAGASVILLERAAEHGGTSSMAGGHFYLGGGTGVQKALGIEDSAEEMFKYLMAVSPDPDVAKIRAYCDDSVTHFDWIEALGMQLPGSAAIPATITATISSRASWPTTCATTRGSWRHKASPPMGRHPEAVHDALLGTLQGRTRPLQPLPDQTERPRAHCGRCARR